MSSKLLSVTLSLFYGIATYNAKGEITSKNELVSITQGSSEWDNFMKHLKANGITEVKVVKAYDLNKVNKDEPVDSPERYEEVKDLEPIQNEVDKYFKAPEKPLTPEQIRIKKLEDQIAQLSQGKNLDETLKDQTSGDADEALKEARDRYFSVVGKKGGVKWTVDEINQKITEFEALQTKRAEYKDVFEKDADEALTLEELDKAIKEK